MCVLKCSSFVFVFTRETTQRDIPMASRLFVYDVDHGHIA